MRKTTILLIVVFLLGAASKTQSQIDKILLEQPEVQDQHFKLNIEGIKPFTSKWYWKKGAEVTMMFASGVAYGYNQVQRHHYSNLLEKHPNLNESFWGPKQWENKWAKDPEGNMIYGQEAFWGSSRWFVAVTDAHHSTMAASYTLATGGLLIGNVNVQPQEWYWHLAEFALVSLVRSVGFVLIHDVIYK